MRAQISTEMIIIIAILLALVLIVATRLRETAETASGQIEKTSGGVFTELNKTLGIVQCNTDDDCQAGESCDEGKCR